MFKINKKKFLIIIVLFFSYLSYTSFAQNRFSYGSLALVDRVIEAIKYSYVKDVPLDSLIKGAIKGIETIVDPHTNYLNTKDFKNLQTSTKGSFGGLGIIISLRKKVLTIISPIEGTPASRVGLSAGDQIISIDDVSTKDISIDNAVSKLRGEKGSPVTLQIKREGESLPFKVKVIRDNIKIKSVPFYTMLNNSVGYIRVVNFSKQTTTDFKKKIENLKNQGMQNLIFDLRNNPGGLLNQAVSMSSLFLEKGQNIVSSKGRTKESNFDFFNEFQPIWKKGLIILVNEGSASASEIVAGSVQDYDRGIILGDTTFGKGSVQSIFNLSQNGDAIKVTTAYYYTPSGRCINLTRLKDGSKDTMVTNTTNQKIFYTQKKRKVYGGGGIIPDVLVPSKSYPLYYLALERNTKFFNFIIKNKSVLEKKYSIDLDFEIPKSLLEEFKKFIDQDTSFLNFKSEISISFNMFKKSVEKDQMLAEKDDFKVMLAQISKQVKELENNRFVENEQHIKQGLKQELLQIVKGDSIRNFFQLTYDELVQKSLELFKNKEEYIKYLAIPNP